MAAPLPAAYIGGDATTERTAFVFLHAIGLSHHSWEATARRVGEQFPVAALTMSGFGAADFAADEDYSLRAQAERVLRWIERDGWERVILVGNSLGGTVALAATVLAPQRMAGLVLASPAAYRNALPWIGRVGCAPEVHRVLGLLPHWGLRLGLEVGSGSPGWTTTEHGRRCQDAFRRRGGTRAFALALKALYGRELDWLAARYETIRCPTLILHGTRDPLIRRASVDQLAWTIPNARLVSLPRLGHFPQEQDPQLLADHCLAFGRQLAVEQRPAA